MCLVKAIYFALTKLLDKLCGNMCREIYETINIIMFLNVFLLVFWYIFNYSDFNTILDDANKSIISIHLLLGKYESYTISLSTVLLLCGCDWC